MITVKVTAVDGWQNGTELVPFGKLRTLEATEDQIKPFVEAKILEMYKSDSPVIPEADAAAIAEKQIKAISEATVAGCMTAFDKWNKTNVQLKMHDRIDDDPTAGFGSFAGFCVDVYKSALNKPTSEAMKIYKAKSLQKTAGHANEGEDAQGGYLVPTQFAASLLQTAIEAAIVRPRATFVPMQTNRIAFPAIKDYDHTETGSGMFGGIKVYRPCEAGDKTPSKPAFQQVQLTLHNLIGLVYASDELLEDSPISIEPLLNTLFGKAIAWKEDKYIVPRSRKAA